MPSKKWSAARRASFAKTISKRRSKPKRKFPATEPSEPDLNPRVGIKEVINHMHQAADALDQKEKLGQSHRLDRIAHLCLLLALDGLSQE